MFFLRSSKIWLTAFALACSSPLTVQVSQAGLIDPQATVETNQLFQRLKSHQGRGVLFGHQNANFEGVGWRFKGTPDVYRVTEKYPAVYGFDFSELKRGISLNNFRKKIIEAHELGAIITMSWHQDNPLTNNSFHDNSGSIDEIFSSQKAMAKLHSDLNMAARFFKSLKDKNGKLIPVLFRPLHESNGGWFWWGKGDKPDYIYLWRHYVWYFRDKSKVRNLIYVYSPAYINYQQDKGYWSRYPGDDWVDVLGYEHYFDTKNIHTEMNAFTDNIKNVVQLAERKGKVVALTEVGTIENLIPDNFWTEVFLKLITKDEFAKKITYALFWRNDNPTHRFVPYPGDNSEENFKVMSTHPVLFFANDEW